MQLGITPFSTIMFTLDMTLVTKHACNPIARSLQYATKYVCICN